MSQKMKDTLAVASALFTLISGITLCFCSFFRNGHVGDGELWYFGQTLVYAASIFGVAMYIKENYQEMKQKILKELKKEDTHATD